MIPKRDHLYFVKINNKPLLKPLQDTNLKYKCLGQWFQKCSLSVNQWHQYHLETARNLNSQSPPQTYWIRNNPPSHPGILL